MHRWFWWSSCNHEGEPGGPCNHEGELDGPPAMATESNHTSCMLEPKENTLWLGIGKVIKSWLRDGWDVGNVIISLEMGDK